MILEGDCREVLRTLPDGHVDAVITDPPYELGFMGLAFDKSGIAYSVELWREVFRVLKPGAHLLAFGGTRTYHRMACAIEDAGFEIRDSIHWMYGSGFPKSMNVSKALDKAAGAERETIGAKLKPDGRPSRRVRHAESGWSRPWQKDPDAVLRNESVTAPATDAAKQWDGWGTALKPSHEPIVLARKPFSGTVIENVQAHGTGALNIDATRVAHASGADLAKHQAGVAAIKARGGQMANSWKNSSDLSGASDVSAAGRWPPNTVLSCCGEEPHAEGCPVAELDRQSGMLTSGSRAAGVRNGIGHFGVSQGDGGPAVIGDSGGASRFFPVFRYCAKASKSERGEDNIHPTVKPIALMRWLCRLITPPKGLILDLFAGSGSTAVAAEAEGFSFVGIEKDPVYAAIARQRSHCPEPEPESERDGGATPIPQRKQLELFRGATERGAPLEGNDES